MPESHNLEGELSLGDGFTADGGCACGGVRYRLTAKPLFVHCCHCSWCQRESGAAFALNAILETSCIEMLAGQTREIELSSESGRGQKVHRCPECYVALWSYYGGAGDKFSFVRVGTLDEPARVPPDIHIYTASKQSWFELSHNIPAVKEYYSRKEYWPEASIERARLAKA